MTDSEQKQDRAMFIALLAAILGSRQVENSPITLEEARCYVAEARHIARAADEAEGES